MTSQRRNVKRSNCPAPNLPYAMEEASHLTYTHLGPAWPAHTYMYISRILDPDPVVPLYPVPVLFHSESEMTTIRRVTHGP